MHEEPADEFGVIQSDRPFRFTWSLTSGRKSRFRLCDREDPAVRNGDPVGVASQIFNGIAEPVESLFYIRAPVFFIQTVFKFIPAIRVLQRFTGRGKEQLFLPEQRVQQRKIFTLKLIPKDVHRNKEVLSGNPDAFVRSQSAARNDTVHMNMVLQFLVPGMEDLNDTGCCAEKLLIGR